MPAHRNPSRRHSLRSHQQIFKNREKDCQHKQRDRRRQPSPRPRPHRSWPVEPVHAESGHNDLPKRSRVPHRFYPPPRTRGADRAGARCGAEVARRGGRAAGRAAVEAGGIAGRSRRSTPRNKRRSARHCPLIHTCCLDDLGDHRYGVCGDFNSIDDALRAATVMAGAGRSPSARAARRAD